MSFNWTRSEGSKSEFRANKAGRTARIGCGDLLSGADLANLGGEGKKLYSGSCRK